ncbi:MAG: hypothetical protein ACK4VM_02715 [Bosea sp. (in: a-proteobacteria)]
MSPSISRRLAIIALSTLTVIGTAIGAELGKPASAPVLTVTGKITHKNTEGAAVFDLAMLEKLPGQVTDTKTPWYKDKTRFEGPLGSELLKAVGATGTVMKITALNDYAVEIPVKDFQAWPVILATRIGGKAISVREKGPLFVIYPFEQDPALYSELYFGRSIWQVKSIEIL